MKKSKIDKLLNNEITRTLKIARKNLSAKEYNELTSDALKAAWEKLSIGDRKKLEEKALVMKAQGGLRQFGAATSRWLYFIMSPYYKEE